MCLDHERTPYETWRLHWLNGWGTVDFLTKHQFYEKLEATGIKGTFHYILSRDRDWQIFYKEVNGPIITVPKPGCGRHGCIINPPKGQAVNGPCRCKL